MSSVWGAQGIEELREAATAVGLGAEPECSDSGVDLVLISPAGGRTLTRVKRISLASAETVGRQLARRDADSRDSPVSVLVADRVTEAARQLLREAGWSWLDLRGHLHLVSAELFVDVDVPRLKPASAPGLPLAGRVGQEVAAFLLLDPARPASVREIARMLDRAPSSVSQALTTMRSAALVDDQRRPTIPHLFWELAQRWTPDSTDLGSCPSPAVTGEARVVNDVLRLGLDDVGTTGWALTETMAAAAYGAAVTARSDHPPDFYVPDQAVMRRALHLLGPASSHETRAATIRVAPFALVCARRVNLPGQAWPLAEPLFVALDLARDPDRGREVLDGWTPPPGVGQRVW
ncbi:hypothetical protein AB0368_31640 [Actinoplanes sp. NPDC051475]|uniref:hypothetical protein n=1 Tax=Actinoplanes sp. NPDC051475 TaxID=3157225 RepID=UPI00344E0463